MSNIPPATIEYVQPPRSDDDSGGITKPSSLSRLLEMWRGRNTDPKYTRRRGAVAVIAAASATIPLGAALLHEYPTDHRVVTIQSGMMDSEGNHYPAPSVAESTCDAVQELLPPGSFNRAECYRDLQGIDLPAYTKIDVTKTFQPIGFHDGTFAVGVIDIKTSLDGVMQKNQQ